MLKLLAGDLSVAEALWQQVQSVDEDLRRNVHGDRFGAIVPIRLYNLMANVVLGRRPTGMRSARWPSRWPRTPALPSRP